MTGTSGKRVLTDWHKSTYSEPGENCVEQALFAGNEVAVRDSKLGETGPVTTFEASDWKAFVASL